MKRPSFRQGVVFAAALGIATSIIVTVSLPLAGAGTIARGLIAGLGFAYVIYLLCASGRRTGRATVIAAWCLMTAVAWWAVPSLALYLGLHIAAVWLIRSLYFHSGAIPALADLALNVLATITAIWAMTRTGSVFLTVWSFFLVQALFTAVPASIRGGRDAAGPDDEAFERARRQAEAALRQLADQ